MRRPEKNQNRLCLADAELRHQETSRYLDSYWRSKLKAQLTHELEYRIDLLHQMTEHTSCFSQAHLEACISGIVELDHTYGLEEVIDRLENLMLRFDRLKRLDNFTIIEPLSFEKEVQIIKHLLQEMRWQARYGIRCY